MREAVGCFHGWMIFLPSLLFSVNFFRGWLFSTETLVVIRFRRLNIILYMILWQLIYYVKNLSRTWVFFNLCRSLWEHWALTLGLSNAVDSVGQSVKMNRLKLVYGKTFWTCYWIQMFLPWESFLQVFYSVHFCIASKAELWNLCKRMSDFVNGFACISWIVFCFFLLLKNRVS